MDIKYEDKSNLIPEMFTTDSNMNNNKLKLLFRSLLDHGESHLMIR